MDSSKHQANVRPTRRPMADALEPRLVFATAEATTYEQFMLELINRARANPSAEAARLGINLNEGVTGTPISTAAKQPLAMNGNLTHAIRTHLNWLRSNSKFQHEGSGNSSPQQRMTDSGYSLSGSYGTAENLGLTLGSSLGDLADRTETLYENLFIDEGVVGRGHRINLLNGAMEEMGSGLATGSYSYDNESWTAILAGQDFGYRPGNPFLTGVVYEDKISPDEFYSPGEGMQSYTVRLTNLAGAVYTATTSLAGGYSMQVPAGTYTLTAWGAKGFAHLGEVVIGGQNVKRDFEAAQFGQGMPLPVPVASVSSDGTLSVVGTTKRDQVSILREGSNLVAVQVNAVKVTFALSAVKRVSVNVGNSNDYVLVGEDIPGGATILGGSGDDTLIGTASADFIDAGDGADVIKAGGGDDSVLCGLGNDQVIGEGGRDTIYGGDGNDRLDGGGGNDAIYGETHDDRLYGGDGNDRLEGGGNVDKVYGEDGNDALIGGGSNDRLYGGFGDDIMWGNLGRDYFDGGPGINAVRDREDIETVLNAA